MKIPLIATAYGSNVIIVRDKEIIRESLPFKPYFITDKPNNFLKSSIIRSNRIPDGIEMDMYKYESDDIKMLEDKAKQLKDEKYNICKLPYIEQLFIDQPEYFLKYSQNNELDILYIDIEVLTKGDGVFPRAQTSPIIAIGCKHNNNRVQIFDNLNGKNDSQILYDFINYYDEINPDVVVTYNGHYFDIPYIIERMIKHEIDINRLGRYGSLKYEEGQEEIHFNGRVHFDCIFPARKDQSLFGIQTRGLKDVSKWFGFNALTLDDDVENTSKLIGTDRLREYLESDVEATKVVADVYLPNAIALSELMQVPLGSIVGCFPSFIPKLIHARHCKKLNLTPLENNGLRYGYTDENTKKFIPGRLYNIGTVFQGAIVDIRKFGYIDNIRKVDFSSYYPSAIRTWNLGPDTTKLTNIYEYEDKYDFYRRGKNMILIFPDSNFNKRLEVTIDMSKIGFLKAEIEQLGAERKRLRELQKNPNITKTEYEAYESRQIAIKVVMNSLFGYQSLQYADYGDMAAGAAITAMCRWTSKYAMSLFDSHIVNVDTDGFILDHPVNLTEINEKIAKYIKNNHGVESYMILDQEDLIDGYFYKMKNYIVRKHKKGKVILEKHGVAFKSSKQASVCNKILDNICEKKLNRIVSDEYLESYKMKKLENYTLKDFKFRVTFSKDLSGYNNGMSLHKILGMQIEERLKIKVEKGLQIDYFVTKEPPPCESVMKLFNEKGKIKGPFYTISIYVNNFEQLDKNYYLDQIDKLFNIFEWNTSDQLKLL